MKQVAGIYLPDGEAHMPDYLSNSGGVYQSRQLRRSLEFVTGWQVAIDIGAHVGLWSKLLVERFARVVAFEPMPPLRACLEKNVVSERLQIVPIALGNEHGAVSFDYDESHTGATHVDPQRQGLIPLGKLDDFRLRGVGYVKIDTEGFELPVVQGARQTLVDNQPIIIVEEKMHGVRHFGQQPYAAVDFLKSLGAKVLDRVVDDFIVGWPDTPGKVNLSALGPAASHQPQQAAVEQEFRQAVERQQQGDIAGACAAYQLLSAQYPDQPEVLNMLAIAQMQLGQTREAWHSAQRAADLRPGKARYQNTLATALWMADQPEAAVTTLRRAVELDPTLCEAWINLAEILAHRGDTAEATRCLERAVELKPNSPDLLLKTGRLHAAHGSAAQASKLFRRALAVQHDCQEARSALARLEGRG